MTANELAVEALLRAHAPHAPETLRARVLANAPARRASTSRRALLVVGAAAVVAVGVAVVHGIVGSGSHPPVASPTVTASQPAWRSAVGGGRSSGAVPANEKQLGPVAAPPLSARVHGTFSTAVAAPSGRLQHTDASLELKVASNDTLASATTRATRIAASLGGYAQSVHYASGGTSIIDLRIPAENVQTAIARLTALGSLVSQRISITDLQQRLQTQSDEITQLRRRIAALEAALKNPSLPDAQRVLLQIRLAESKRALSQRLHARKGTISAGTMAHVAVRIGTKKSIVPVHHRGRLGRIVHTAVGFLVLEAIIVLFALIVVSPVAIVAGLVWWWRRRSVDRLLAA
jgi:uncharacterized protein DUF4349